MTILRPTELKSIEQFFQLKQDRLLQIMTKYLKSKYETVHATKDYVVAVGDIPVALVAHLDTVFQNPPKDIFYDREKNVMWSPEGLGADDRAGVYSIIQILKKGFKPTVIFTTDEETGAIGALQLIKDFPKGVTELKYIIELDRRGCDDCVFYDCDNILFEEYVETFGFVTSFGSFSDISVLCPTWGVAGVNLSIGYMNEHSTSEVLYVGHMFATINKVAKMLKTINDVIEPYQYIPATYRKFCSINTNNDFGWDPSFGISRETWDSWHVDPIKECAYCGQIDYEYNHFPTKTPEGGTIILCGDCLSSLGNVSWCINCGEPFFVEDEKPHRICYDCVERGLAASV